MIHVTNFEIATSTIWEDPYYECTLQFKADPKTAHEIMEWVQERYQPHYPGSGIDDDLPPEEETPVTGTLVVGKDIYTYEEN